MLAETSKDLPTPDFKVDLFSAIESVEDFVIINLPGFGREINLSREIYFNSKLILNFNKAGTEFIFGDVVHKDTLASEDIGVFARESNINQEPFYVFECKRLPTPPGRSNTEYVKGRVQKNEGGIERFKQRIHGADLKKSGMIGYVEENNFSHWHEQINSWILELAKNNPDSTINWEKSEILGSLRESHTVSTCRSKHCILQTTETIELTHFWVILSSQ